MKGAMYMSKADFVSVEGTVVETLRGGTFKVQLDDVPGSPIITAKLSGKLKTNYIRIINGDRVTVDISPYDLTKGRITWRYK